MALNLVHPLILVVQYEHEGHKKIEGTIIVKEVRGNFGKERWDKAELKEIKPLTRNVQ